MQEPHYTDEPEESYFAIITEEVLYSKELTDRQKLLFACITNLARKKGYCWASNKYFSEKLERDMRTIQRDISSLKDLGFITSVTHYNEKNEVKYRLLAPLIPRIPPEGPPRLIEKKQRKKQGGGGKLAVGGGGKDVTITRQVINETRIKEKEKKESLMKEEKEEKKGEDFSFQEDQINPTRNPEAEPDNKSGSLPKDKTYIDAQNYPCVNGERWVMSQEEFNSAPPENKEWLEREKPEQFSLLQKKLGAPEHLFKKPKTKAKR